MTVSRERCSRVLLLAVLMAAAPLACVHPTDPLWIDGVYDGADSDDVIQVATSLEARVADRDHVVHPVLCVTDLLPSARSIAAFATLESTQPRAPPTT